MHRPNILVLGIAVLLSACESTSEVIPTQATGFPKNISTIVEANCLGRSCHSVPTALNDSLVLSSWDAMVRGGRNLNDVIPYHARLSQLFLHVNTDASIALPASPRMPLSRNPLTSEDQQAIFSWIEAGAPDINGRIPYADATKKIYITNVDADYVSYIDAETNRLIGALGSPKDFEPISIVFSKDKSKLFVGSKASAGIIKRFRQGERNSEAEFASGLKATDIKLLPDDSKGYIANFQSATPNRFGVFDPVGMTLTRYVESNLIADPIAFTATADGTRLYVACYSSDNVICISTANDSIIQNLRMANDVPTPPPATYAPQYGPSALALSPDGSKLFVTSLMRGEVTVFDLTSDAILTRIPVQTLPGGVAVTPEGTELWVANTASQSISIIDVNTLAVKATLDTVASEPRNICFSPDGALAYIACQGLKGASHHTGGAPPSSVAVIDRASRKLVKTIELPSFSVGIARGY